MEKVKLEGRRRLCKVSSKVSDDDNDDHQKEITTQDSFVPIGIYLHPYSFFTKLN